MQSQAFRRKKGFNRIFLILLYILLVIIIWVLCVQYINKNLKKQMLNSFNALAVQKAAWLDNKMTTRLSLLENIADELVESGEFDFSNSTTIAEDIKQLLGLYEITIVDGTGKGYSSDLEVYDLSDTKAFQTAIEGVPYVSEIIQEDSENYEEVQYSVPIIDLQGDGEIIGVLMATDVTENFVQEFRLKGIEEQGYMYLLDSEGNIVDENVKYEVYETDNLLEILQKYSSNEAVAKQIQNNVENREKITIYYNTGENQYAIGIPLKMNNWYMMMVIPEKIINEQLVLSSYSINILFSFVFILSVIMLLYIVISQGKKHNYLKDVAYIDPVTGLYNKNYLKDNMENNILQAKRKNTALVIYNIQKFKVFNELYGTEIGNDIIHLVAKVLKSNIQHKGEIALHGYADEFAFLYFYNTKEEMEKRIRNCLKEIERLVYSKLQIIINVAVGIYEIEEVGYSFERIYNFANMAKNKNKECSKEELTYYSKELVELELDRKRLEDSIREGIQKKEFKAWFQPQFHCETNKIVGCEALARWYTSDGRILTPYHFIEVSERSSLIYDIDQLIFEDVCKKIREWLDMGITCVPTSVNLSRVCLNSLDMLYELKSIADKYKIPKGLIQLEITESAIVENEKVLKQVIQHMHNLGFDVLLDDFGVGYSSLMAINSLQFDVLKIDKTFVDAIDTKNGKFIIEYTINLGRQLGMNIIIEGVETKEQYEYLKQFGDISLQGYYFSRPVDSHTMEEMLEKM